MATAPGQVLVQCHLVRSSRLSSERPLASDSSVVRLVRLANPAVDTCETVLKCICEGSSSAMGGKGEPFLQPLVEFLSQADVNYITFGSSSGTSSLLKMRGGGRGGSSPSPRRSRQGMVEVAVYPAYNDGACNMSGGGLKIRSTPLLQQLEQRSGVPFVKNAAAIVPISVVMAWEAPAQKRASVTLQPKQLLQQPTSPTQLTSPKRQASVVFLDDDDDADSKNKRSAPSAPVPAAPAIPSLLGDQFGDEDALQNAGEIGEDEDSAERRRARRRAAAEEEESVLYELPNLSRGGSGGGKAITEARARRLEMMRRENIAKKERERLERESRARQHAEQWEQVRAEQRLQERNMLHQAEMARQRHEAREEELQRKKAAYEGRERELTAERREFNRRLEETRTLQQIELLKTQGQKEGGNKAHGGISSSQSSSNLHDKLQKENSGLQQKGSESSIVASAADALQILSGGDNRSHVADAHDLSKRLEKNLDGEVMLAVNRSNEGDKNLEELELQREAQIKEAADAMSLRQKLRELQVSKATSGSHVRRRLLEYDTALKALQLSNN